MEGADLSVKLRGAALFAASLSSVLLAGFFMAANELLPETRLYHTADTVNLATRPLHHSQISENMEMQVWYRLLRRRMICIQNIAPLGTQLVPVMDCDLLHRIQQTVQIMLRSRIDITKMSLGCYYRVSYYLHFLWQKGKSQVIFIYRPHLYGLRRKCAYDTIRFHWLLHSRPANDSANRRIDAPGVTAFNKYYFFGNG